MHHAEISRLRNDDLQEALSTFSADELDPLYAILTRPTFEGLSTEERVKSAFPSHDEYSDRIAHHLRLFGGNSFANLGRGAEGPSYREIVQDVCRSRKVKVEKSASAVQMEQALLAHLFASLPQDEQDAILAEAAERYGSSRDFFGPAVIVGLLATQVGGRAAGFILYRTGLQAANIMSRALISRGLSFAGNQLLVRTLGVATGPIGWGICSVLAARDIASPALRVTTPCVILIAGTRQAKLWQHEMEVAA